MSPIRFLPRLRCLAMILPFALVVSLAHTRAASATGERAGEATIVSTDELRPLTGGDGETPFTIFLPQGAACPGDSTQEQYRVQGFLAPGDVDPGTLIYKGMRPRAEGAWALYETSSRTFMNAATDMASDPGGEGRILGLPPFSFAVFDPGMVAPGRYHIGIACSLWTETERYWSTMIDVEADDQDVAGISWTVVDPPDGAVAPDGGGVSGLSLALGAAGIVFAGLTVASAVSRRRSPERSAPGPQSVT